MRSCNICDKKQRTSGNKKKHKHVNHLELAVLELHQDRPVPPALLLVLGGVGRQGLQGAHLAPCPGSLHLQGQLV